MFFIDFRDRRRGRERDINVRNIDQLPPVHPNQRSKLQHRYVP